MSFFQEIIDGLKKATSGAPFKNAAALARACGVESNLITRWISGQRVPRLDRLGEVLDTIGVQVIFPGDDSKSKQQVVASRSLFDEKLGETLKAAAALFSDDYEELASKVYGTPKKTGRLKALFSGKNKISAEECYLICTAIGISPQKAMDRAQKLVNDAHKTKDQSVA